MTGLYSKFVRGDLAKRLEEFRNDKDWADLREELALMRTLLTTFIEKYQDSMEDEETVKWTINMTDQIGKLVEKLHKIEYGEKYVVTVNALQAYAVRIGDLINKYVEDEDARANLSEELLALFQTKNQRIEQAPIFEYPTDTEDLED